MATSPMNPEGTRPPSRPVGPGLRGHADLERVLDTVNDRVVGDRMTLRKLLAGALAGGHILFEDHPGLGKTLLTKVFARAIGLGQNRVQFTPDLLPADILGTKVWNTVDRRFELMKGPVFTNVLLADEINRAPPKTQSALLEAMEERQATIEGETVPLGTPFIVLATQNPIEQEGTYPLPEAQLDRFMLKLGMGYPRTLESEVEILARRLQWKTDDPSRGVTPVMDADAFRGFQQEIEDKVHVHPHVLVYIARLVRAVREHPLVAAGPSPRGALSLLRASRAMAFIAGREFVTPDDVKILAEDALAHRIILDLERATETSDPRTIVRDITGRIETPTRFGRPPPAGAAQAAAGAPRAAAPRAPTRRQPPEGG